MRSTKEATNLGRNRRQSGNSRRRFRRLKADIRLGRLGVLDLDCFLVGSGRPRTAGSGKSRGLPSPNRPRKNGRVHARSGWRKLMDEGERRKRLLPECTSWLATKAKLTISTAHRRNLVAPTRTHCSNRGPDRLTDCRSIANRPIHEPRPRNEVLRFVRRVRRRFLPEFCA